MKSVLLIAALTLSSLSHAYDGTGEVGSVDSKTATIVCNYVGQNDASMANSPLIIKQVGANKFELYQSSGFANMPMVVGEKTYTVNKLEGDYQRQDSQQNVLVVSSNWGSRFAPTGTYGHRQVAIDTSNGSAHLTNDIKPAWLFEDFNAPQGHRTQESDLHCERK